MPQVVVLRIAGYGPWTLRLGSDREHRLQMLQASLYGKVQELFSGRGGLAFLNRADEFFVVSDGLGPEGLAGIMEELQRGAGVKLAASVGTSPTPLGADCAAHESRLSGVLLREDPEMCGSFGSCGAVTVLHMDVEGLASVRGKRTPYEVAYEMLGLHRRMARFFMMRESMAFFMGGDNFMVLAAGSRAGVRVIAEGFVEAEEKETGIVLNCGIGTAFRPREAASRATGSLDAVRGMRGGGGGRLGVRQRVHEAG